MSETLCVAADGTWFVGDWPVVHAGTLRHLKSRLVFEEDGAFLVEGARRLEVRVEGPAFEVVSLGVDHWAAEARVELDDGSVETVAEGALELNAATGRFECRVRGGRATARLGRGAHQALLAHAGEDEQGFFLRLGPRRLGIRAG